MHLIAPFKHIMVTRVISQSGRVRQISTLSKPISTEDHRTSLVRSSFGSSNNTDTTIITQALAPFIKTFTARRHQVRFLNDKVSQQSNSKTDRPRVSDSPCPHEWHGNRATARSHLSLSLTLQSPQSVFGYGRTGPVM